jgi:hypothetical protein
LSTAFATDPFLHLSISSLLNSHFSIFDSFFVFYFFFNNFILDTIFILLPNYKLFYEDGSFIEIPLKARVNIGHFNSKYGIIDARIGYQTEDKEKNMFRIYIYQFENPYPEKEIKKVEFYRVENSEKMIPVLFALTIGK